MTVAVMDPSELEALVKRAVEAGIEALLPKGGDELLPTEQLADVLGVSPDLVRLWVRTKDCPHIRVGVKKLRFRLADVLAWLEEGDAA